MSRILASLFAGLFAATVLVASPVAYAAKSQTTTTKTAKADHGKKKQKNSGTKKSKSGKTAKQK